jgi:hypothetical protein
VVQQKANHLQQRKRRQHKQQTSWLAPASY